MNWKILLLTLLPFTTHLTTSQLSDASGWPKTFSNGQRYLASPTFGNDGRIIVSAFIDGGSHLLITFSTAGTTLWTQTVSTFPTGANADSVFGMESSPAVAPNGNIYLGSYDQKIHCYTQSGTHKWGLAPVPGRGGFLRTAPIVDKNGHIYAWFDRDVAVSGSVPHLYKIRDNGTSITVLYDWAAPTDQATEARAISSPALATDGTVYVCTYFNVGNERRGHFFAVNSSGQLSWRYPALSDNTCLGSIVAPPSIAQDGTIYIGTQSGQSWNPSGTYNPTFVALDPNPTASQRVKWFFPDGSSDETAKGVPSVVGAFDAAATIDQDGTLYVAIDAPTSMVVALTPEGVVKWRTTGFNSGSGFTTDNSPILGADGTVWVKDMLAWGADNDGVSFLHGLNPATGAIVSTTEVPRDNPHWHEANDVPYAHLAMNKDGRIVVLSSTSGTPGAVPPDSGKIHFLQTGNAGYSFWPKWGANRQNTYNVQHNPWNLRISPIVSVSALPRLQGSTGYEAATWVNSKGHICGWGQNANYQQAAVWHFVGGSYGAPSVIPLLFSGHTTAARCINDNGLVVGVDSLATTTAWMWTAADGISALPQLATYSNFDAVGCNRVGMVVGSGKNSNGKYRAMRWNDIANEPEDLGSLAGGTDPNELSYGFAINNAGTIVGKSVTSAPGVFHGFKTPFGQNIISQDDVGTLSGNASDYSEARAINASGRIAGASTISANQTNAFIKPPVIASTSAFQNVGHLGGNYAVITSLNNRGQAVGWSKNAAGLPEGFLIQPNGTLQSLDGLLFYYSVKNISHAVITDDGKIAGTGLFYETGVGWTQRAFVIVVTLL